MKTYYALPIKDDVKRFYQRCSSMRNSEFELEDILYRITFTYSNDECMSDASRHSIVKYYNFLYNHDYNDSCIFNEAIDILITSFVVIMHHSLKSHSPTVYFEGFIGDDAIVSVEQ